MWSVWVAQNNVVFNHLTWTKAKLEGAIWTGLTNYGQTAWRQIQRRKFKTKAAHAEAIIKFNTAWTPNSYLSKRQASQVLWNHFNFYPS
jgi:hypothetical protein